MKKIILASATLLFVACSGNSTNSENTSQSEVTASDSKGSSAKKGKSVKYDAKCFEAFNYDYSKMLTKEDVLKHVSVSNPDELEVNFKESRISKQHNKYSITWSSDRSDKNAVAIEKISFKKGTAEKALQDFDRAYGQVSEEEYRQMEARIDEQQKDKSEEERKVMKSMVRARENMQFHPVANVGSGAYWEREEVSGVYFGTNLHVLAGTVEFRIKVKVSNDDEENARIAALLAQEVLNKCK